MPMYNTVTKFETFDGKLFDTTHKADEHVLNALYEEINARLKPLMATISPHTLYKVVIAIVSENPQEALDLITKLATIANLDCYEKA